MPNTILETLDELDALRRDRMYCRFSIRIAQNYDELSSALRRALAVVEEMRVMDDKGDWMGFPHWRTAILRKHWFGE